MARSNFSGPVRSEKGFETPGPVTLSGTVNLSNLPTSDPGVAGQLWNNAGVLNVSAG